MPQYTLSRVDLQYLFCSFLLNGVFRLPVGLPILTPATPNFENLDLRLCWEIYPTTTLEMLGATFCFLQDRATIPETVLAWQDDLACQMPGFSGRLQQVDHKWIFFGPLMDHRCWSCFLCFEGGRSILDCLTTQLQICFQSDTARAFQLQCIFCWGTCCWSLLTAWAFAASMCRVWIKSSQRVSVSQHKLRKHDQCLH